MLREDAPQRGRVDRQDDRIGEGTGIEGESHAGDERDVAEHVARSQQLQRDLAAVHTAGQLDGALAHDEHPCGGVPHGEDLGAPGMV